MSAQAELIIAVLTLAFALIATWAYLAFDFTRSREYIEDALRQAYRRGWQASIDEWQRTYEQGRARRRK